MSFHTARSRYQGTIRATIAQIREHKKRNCVFEKDDDKSPSENELRAELERGFNLWWDSWIEPNLEYLARKDKKYVPKEKS